MAIEDGRAPRGNPSDYLPKFGRPKGAENKATREIREVCQQLTLMNPKYMDGLRRRLESGRVSPAVEQTILAYGYGKPKETIEVEVGVSVEQRLLVLALRSLPTETLRALRDAQYAIDEKMRELAPGEVLDLVPEPLPEER